MLTAEEARRLFSYDPETGVLTRKVRTANRTRVGDIAGWKFRNRGKEYLIVAVNSKKHYVHRLIWLIVTGSWPLNEVDHENGCGTDNRWNNLRCVTHIENSRNTRRREDNTSGFTGVGWAKNMKKWVAYISVEGEFLRLGHFEDIEDAISARKSAEIKYRYHKNHGSDRPL